MQKGQSVVEYTIILGIVLLVVTSVVVLLQSDFLGRSGINTQQETLVLEQLDIGIVAHGVNQNTSFVRLVNNKEYQVNVTNMTLNGVLANSSQLPVVLNPYAQQNIVIHNVNATPEARYRYAFSITYQDVLSGQQFTVNDSSLYLKGTVGYE